MLAVDRRGERDEMLLGKVRPVTEEALLVAKGILLYLISHGIFS